jgi:hypothetical protein
MWFFNQLFEYLNTSMSSSEKDDVLLAATSKIVMKYKKKKITRQSWKTKFKHNPVE